MDSSFLLGRFSTIKLNHPRRLFTYGHHGATSQKMAAFITTAARNVTCYNPTYLSLFMLPRHIRLQAISQPNWLNCVLQYKRYSSVHFLMWFQEMSRLLAAATPGRQQWDLSLLPLHWPWLFSCLPSDELKGQVHPPSWAFAKAPQGKTRAASQTARR